MRSGDPVQVESQNDLAKALREGKAGDVFATTLQTDERVLARVTDGIYRQPGSALRELISNAYDADATRVTIQTDRPRFDQISIADDGHGMSPSALAHVLHHIGGSAKRHADGAELGITAQADPLRSPGGRRLIGKIGIGLFSVSQLTNSFEIITKTKGDRFRTIASVVLRQYSDEPVEDDGEVYEAGKVNLWRETAEDVDSHGTRIVLTKIRPSTKKLLRSSAIWEAIEQSETLPDGSRPPMPPKFHIGRLVGGGGDELREANGGFDATPWGPSDSPVEAFEKLVDEVWAEAGRSTPNSQLSEIFDAYLQMVWDLSLAVPLTYVAGHPFDLPFGDDAYVFTMPASPKEPPTEVELSEGETLRAALDLSDEVGLSSEFSVVVDDLELRRPLKFQGLPTTSNAVKKPMIFVGSCREDFSEFPDEFTGGPLAFEAYLFWNPKIAPTEHRGALLRIHESTGSPFDPTFLRYQVSEQNRLRQITCEVFVTQGLDGALNIDRESLNFAHPHAVYISRWLHSALRRLATVQKRVAKEIRDHDAKERGEQRDSARAAAIAAAWEQEADDDGSAPPEVLFIGDDADARSDGYVIARDDVFQSSEDDESQSSEDDATPIASHSTAAEERLAAIVQVLSAFNVLDSLDRGARTRLLRSLAAVLESFDQ